MRILPRAVTLGFLLFGMGCMLGSSNLPTAPPGESAADAKGRRKKVIGAITARGGVVDAGAAEGSLLVVSLDLHGFHGAGHILKSLTPLSKLRVLNVYNTGFTDANLEMLCDLPDLMDLNLNDNPITDAGLERLRRLPNLRKLALQDTQVTDAGLPSLRHIPELQHLTLGDSPRISDTGVAQLIGLKKLENLTLHGKAITDRSLESLRSMTGLRELALLRTSVTDAGVAELKKALPKLQVIR